MNPLSPLELAELLSARQKLADQDLLRVRRLTAELADLSEVRRTQALAVTALWQRESLCAEPYILAWRELLAMPPNAAIAKISEPGSRVLRSNSPFSCMAPRGVDPNAA